MTRCEVQTMWARTTWHLFFVFNIFFVFFVCSVFIAPTPKIQHGIAKHKHKGDVNNNSHNESNTVSKL